MYWVEQATVNLRYEGNVFNRLKSVLNDLI
jgi:hypothetical protein